MTEIAAQTVVQADVPAQAIDVVPASGKPRPVQVQQSQRLDPSVPARTTFQEDLTTASQRRVNLIWEYTQAAIALMVVVATMACGIVAMINEAKQIPTIIGVAFGMVTGFYFSRTNHAAIGGVGAKPSEEYKGR
jgi:hypothetical protein